MDATATNGTAVPEAHSANENTGIDRRSFLAASGLALASFTLSDIARSEEPTKKEVDLKVGDSFPKLSLPDTTGKELDLLKETSGKLTIVEFWGPWCGPCLQQVPHLKEAAAKLSGKEFVDPESGEAIGKDVAVFTVAVNFSEHDTRTWKNMVQQGKFPGSLHTGTEDFSLISENYGVSGFPTNFVLDGSGTIIMRNADVPSLPALLKKYTK